MIPSSERPASLPLTPLPAGMMPAEVLTVNGTGMTPLEFQATRQGGRATRWLAVCMGALLSVLGISAASLTTVYVGISQGTLVWTLLFAAWIAMGVGSYLHKKGLFRAEKNAWRVYAAETEGGVVTTVYPDRIEQYSARWRQTVVLDHTTRYLESADWLLVQTGTQCAVLRAADVTPGEAQAVFERLATAIPPERRFSKGEFLARRVNATPPPFSLVPPACYEQITYWESTPPPATPRKGVWLWCGAGSVVVGSLLAVLFGITPWYLADLLGYILVCLLGTGCFSWLVLRHQTPPAAAREITLAFTAEGLKVCENGTEQFVAARDVYAQRTHNGARLFTPAGEYTVLWTVTQRRQQLEWMLFGQHPASF